MNIKKVTESELFDFLVSLQLTTNEAGFIYQLLENEPDVQSKSLISFERIVEVLKFVRENIPEEHRKSPLFGVN